MIIKEKFFLLRDVPNILNLSNKEVENIQIEKGNTKLYYSIKLIENRISHFTKDKILKNLEDLNLSEKILNIVELNSYPLILGYNKPTKQILINLSYFGVSDVTEVNSKDLYSATVYAFMMHSLVTKQNIKEDYASPIINFLISVFVRAFGKEYGLLGAYSKEIIKIKFLLACYILKSFFNSSNFYKKAYSYSGFDYKSIENDLNKYDFSNILQFIDSLSYFNALPGITRYKFSSTFLKFLSLNFIPALEDLSRFISILNVSSLVGSSIIPTHIKYYNKVEFEKIIEIGKRVF